MDQWRTVKLWCPHYSWLWGTENSCSTYTVCFLFGNLCVSYNCNHSINVRKKNMHMINDWWELSGQWKQNKSWWSCYCAESPQQLLAEDADCPWLLSTSSAWAAVEQWWWGLGLKQTMALYGIFNKTHHQFTTAQPYKNNCIMSVVNSNSDNGYS